MAKVTLDNIVVKMEDGGFTMVVLVSGMGAGNPSIWKELKVISGM